MAVAFMCIYTVMVIGIIELAFSLITVIPERVMHWIGVQGMAQDHSRATMQMAQGAAREVGSSAGKALPDASKDVQIDSQKQGDQANAEGGGGDDDDDDGDDGGDGGGR